MPQKESYQWLSVHLYYNEPWEIFLAEGLLPYIHTTLKTGIAHQYFFIRYWDRGPHIRLRFLGDSKLLTEVLRPNLIEHFESYFDLLPSTRAEPRYPSNIPDELRWLPNNSVQLEDYQPESSRYGGPKALALAEKHFFYSSQIVLQYLAERASNWTYEDALSLAVKLHLSMVHAMGMTQKMAQTFFHFYFYNWLPHAFRLLSGKSQKKSMEAQTRETLSAFEAAYEAQKDTLRPFHQSLWAALDQKEDFEEEPLNQWIVQNRQLGEDLVDLQEKSLFHNRPMQYQFQPTARIPLSDAEKQRWMQYADYLHMTNNRLGVLNQDEGYLAFLMMKSME